MFEKKIKKLPDFTFIFHTCISIFENFLIFGLLLLYYIGVFFISNILEYFEKFGSFIQALFKYLDVLLMTLIETHVNFLFF